MDNRLYASFFLHKQSVVTKKHSIYLRITVAGKRELINTGVSVLATNWDNAKGRIKNNDEDAFTNNKLLAALHTKLTEIYTDSLKQNLPVSANMIGEKLRSPGEQSEYLIPALGQNFSLKGKKLFIDGHKWVTTIEKAYPALEAEFKRIELEKALTNEERNASFAVLITRWGAIVEEVRTAVKQNNLTGATYPSTGQYQNIAQNIKEAPG